MKTLYVLPFCWYTQIQRHFHPKENIFEKMFESMNLFSFIKMLIIRFLLENLDRHMQ